MAAAIAWFGFLMILTLDTEKVFLLLVEYLGKFQDGLCHARRHINGRPTMWAHLGNKGLEDLGKLELKLRQGIGRDSMGYFLWSAPISMLDQSEPCEETIANRRGNLDNLAGDGNSEVYSVALGHIAEKFADLESLDELAAFSTMDIGWPACARFGFVGPDEFMAGFEGATVGFALVELRAFNHNHIFLGHTSPMKFSMEFTGREVTLRKLYHRKCWNATPTKSNKKLSGGLQPMFYNVKYCMDT